MKKIFVFACLLLTPVLAHADIAYPGRKYDPNRYNDRVIPAQPSYVQDIVVALILFCAFCGLVESLHLCWKGYKNPAARAAYLLHAAAYASLAVMTVISLFAFARVPSLALPVIMSAIGLFWFLRRMAKKRMPKN